MPKFIATHLLKWQIWEVALKRHTELKVPGHISVAQSMWFINHSCVLRIVFELRVILPQFLTNDISMNLIFPKKNFFSNKNFFPKNFIFSNKNFFPKNFIFSNKNFIFPNLSKTFQINYCVLFFAKKKIQNFYGVKIFF